MHTTNAQSFKVTDTHVEIYDKPDDMILAIPLELFYQIVEYAFDMKVKRKK